MNEAPEEKPEQLQTIPEAILKMPERLLETRAAAVVVIYAPGEIEGKMVKLDHHHSVVASTVDKEITSAIICVAHDAFHPDEEEPPRYTAVRAN